MVLTLVFYIYYLINILTMGLAITLAFCNGFPSESFTVPVRVWEREKIGIRRKNSKFFGIKNYVVGVLFIFKFQHSTSYNVIVFNKRNILSVFWNFNNLFDIFFYNFINYKRNIIYV
jgi:hypothetical protein